MGASHPNLAPRVLNKAGAALNLDLEDGSWQTATGMIFGFSHLKIQGGMLVMASRIPTMGDEVHGCECLTDMQNTKHKAKNK